MFLMDTQPVVRRRKLFRGFGVNGHYQAHVNNLLSSRCSCHHDNLHVNAKTSKARGVRQDPTRTMALRNKFAAELSRRMRAIQVNVIQSVVNHDCFGLSAPPRVQTLAAIPSRAFQFKTTPAKVDGFMNWLHDQANQGILGLQPGEDRGVTGEVPWANTYIESSYKKGMRRAEEEMKKAGMGKPLFPEVGGSGVNAIDAMFNTPIHADRVAMIYNRVYTDLKGITDVMDKEISKTLAQGLVDGKGARELAREINNRVSQAGGSLAIKDTAGEVTMRAEQRAIILARTEIIAAHHVGAIATYREAGVEGVIVQAEWSTAGDDRVCEECQALEGKVYELDEIEGMIPLHPQCRCVALPVVKGFTPEAPPPPPPEEVAVANPDYDPIRLPSVDFNGKTVADGMYIETPFPVIKSDIIQSVEEAISENFSKYAIDTTVPETINITKLRSMVNAVPRDKVVEAMQIPAASLKAVETPVIIMHAGRQIVWDGIDKISAAIARGEKTMDVRVLKVTKPVKGLPKPVSVPAVPKVPAPPPLEIRPAADVRRDLESIHNAKATKIADLTQEIQKLDYVDKMRQQEIQELINKSTGLRQISAEQFKDELKVIAERIETLYKEDALLEKQLPALRHLRADVRESIIVEQRKALMMPNVPPADLAVTWKGGAFKGERLTVNKDGQEFVSQFLGKPFSDKYGIQQTASSTKQVSVTVQHKGGTRSQCSGKILKMTSNADRKTAVHETAHAMENTFRGLEKACSDFRNKRTSGEPLEKLSKIMKDVDPDHKYGYKRDEVARRDKFVYPDTKTPAPYCGKYYNWSSDANEIFSMGMQWMYQMPREFAAADPEYFDFIYNLRKMWMQSPVSSVVKGVTP